MNIPMRIFMELLLLVFVTVFGRMGVLPQVSVQMGDYWKNPHSMLAQVDTEVRTEDDFLYYGELVIKLPQGVKAVEQKGVHDDRGAQTVIDLTQAGDGRLAPRIWLAHYTMENYNEWAMTSALLDMLPDTTLYFCYRDGEKNINFFRYTYGVVNGFVLARGDDIYLAWEVCAEAAFEELLDSQDVCWADGSPVYVEGNGDAAWFDRLVVGDTSFQAVRYTADDGRRWLMLMQDGKYGQVYQKIAIDIWVLQEQLICKDYNFDGYMDINFSSERLYLWNPDTQLYEETPVPKEFMQLQSEVLFPDTKVIWGYDAGADAAHWYDRVETETFWQWDGKNLIKKRECKAQVRGEMVQLQAYDSVGDFGAEFDEAVTLEAYQQGSAEVRELYGRFYDGMAPLETYARAHTREYGKEHMQYIPQELLESIDRAMCHETDPSASVPGGSGSWMSEKEILAVAKENTDLRSAVARAAACPMDIDYAMLMADGDNDGIMDIIAGEVSDGLTDIVFYQGQADGTYVKTDVYSSVQNGFKVARFEGKNYLFCTCYDWGRQRYENASVLCFVDGKSVEQADFTLVPESYAIVPAQYTQMEYSPYVRFLMADALLYKETFDEKGMIVSHCEKELGEYEKYPYQCDLNNDGVAEQYTKNLYHAGNGSISREYVHFDGEGEGMIVANDALYSLAGSPAAVWAESFQGEIIVNMMVPAGREDFEIASFLLTGTEYEKICGVCAAADYSVRVRGRLCGHH